MKYMTKNNLKKVTEMFVAKDYDYITAEDMAITCFVAAQQFGEDVLDVVKWIEYTYKPRIVKQ